MFRRAIILVSVAAATALLASGAPADTVSSQTPAAQVTAELGEVVEDYPAVDLAVEQALSESDSAELDGTTSEVVRAGSRFSVAPRPDRVEVPGSATSSTEFHFGAEVVRFMLEGQDDSAPAKAKGITSSRNDVFDGVDSHHVTWNAGVEEFLHVSKASAAQTREFTWLVDLPDGWSLMSVGSAVDVLDENQLSVLQFQAPWAQSSVGQRLARPQVDVEQQRSAIRVKVPGSIARGEYVLDPVWLLSGAVGNYRWRTCGAGGDSICEHGSTSVPDGWQATTSSGHGALFNASFSTSDSAALSTNFSAIPAGAFVQWLYTPPTGIKVKQLSWLGTQTLSTTTPSSPMQCLTGWSENGTTFTWSSGSTGSGAAYEETALGTYPTPDDLWSAVALGLVNTSGSSHTPITTADGCATTTTTGNQHLTLLLYDAPENKPEASIEIDDADHDGIVGPQQASVDVAIEATDVGSGVRRVEQAVDGIGFATVGTDCASSSVGTTGGSLNDDLADVPCALTVNVPSTPLPLSGLSDGSHDVHSRATDFAGNVSDVDTASFEWDATAPSAPSAVKLNGENAKNWLDDWYLKVDDEVAAAWSPSTDVNLLRHEARIVPAAEECTTMSGVTSWATVSSSNGIIDTLSLTDAAEYKWCVRGVDRANNVGTASSVTFTVDTSAPTDVAGLSTPVSTDPVILRVAWSTAASDVSPVRYEVCGSSIGIDGGVPNCDLGAWSRFGPSTMSATATLDAGVEETDTVYVCVIARDLFDRISDGVCTTAALDFTAPPAPEDVLDGASGPDVDIIDPIEPLSGDDRLDARWTGSAGADGYLSCFTQLTSCHPSAPVTPVPGALDESVTIWTITDTFMPGTLIRFCISATDEAGNISPASCSDGAVIDGTPPRMLRVDDGTGADAARQTSTTTYAAHWSSDFEFAAINEYEWALCTVPCITPEDSGTTSTTSINLTGISLDLGATYRLCVTAVDILGRESEVTCSNGTEVFAYSTDVHEVHDGNFGYDQSVIAEGGTLTADWYRSPSANPGVTANWEICSAAPCTDLGSFTEATGTDATGEISASVSVTKGMLYYVCVEIPGGAVSCSDGALGAEAAGSGSTTTGVFEVPVTARQPSETFDVDQIKFGDSYTAGWTMFDDEYSTFWRLCADSACVTEVDRGVLKPLQTSVSFERPSVSTTWYTCVVVVDNNTGDALTKESCSDGATVVGFSPGTVIATGLTGSSAVISHDTVWSKDNSPYLVYDSLTLGRTSSDALSPATLTIEPGVVVKFASGGALRVAEGSHLFANGTPKSPVIFTSIHDDDADTVDSDLDVVAPSTGDWSELRFDEGSGGTLNGVNITYSGGMTIYGDDVTWRNGNYLHGGQTLVEGYRTRFENLRFFNNSGPIHVNSGGSIVMRDSVVENNYGTVALAMSIYEEPANGDPASPRSVLIGNTFSADAANTLTVEYDSGAGPVFSNGPLIRGNNLRMPDDGTVTTGTNFGVQIEPTWTHNYWGVVPALGQCSVDGSSTWPTDIPTVLTDSYVAHDAPVFEDDWQYCSSGTPWAYPVDGIATHPAYAEPIAGGVVDDSRLGSDEDLQPTTDLDATDPVNTFIGNFHHTRVDFEIQVPGEDPTIARTFNSLDIMPGLFGDGWSSVLDTNLEVAGDRAVFRSESGQRVEFARKRSGGWSQLGAPWNRLTTNLDGEFELRVRDGRTYRFNELGELTERLDRHGNGFRIEREADPEEDFTIIDTAGGTVAVDVDAGRVQTLDASDGRSISYEYLETGARPVAKVTDEYGGTWQYGYDGVGRMSCEKNPNGNLVFENEYAPHGEVIRQWDGARGGCAALGDSIDSATPTQFEFDRTNPLSQVTTVTDPAGGEWIHTYDADGATTSSTDPVGNCTSYEYDADGNLELEIRPNGLMLTRTFDARGRATSTTYGRSSSAVNEQWHCSGSSLPAPSSDTLDEPFTDTVTYDDDTSNVLTSERLYDGAVDAVNQRVFSYDGRENLEQIEAVGDGGTSTPCESGVDRCITYEYDSHGQLVERVDSRGKTSTYAWDVRGHQVRSTPAGLGATRTSFDQRGRPTRVTRETDGFVTGLTSSTWFIYDDAEGGDHRIARIIDPNGATTTFDRDSAGNVTSIVDAENRRWENEYNEFDELARETGPGVDRTFEYDERGLLVATIDGGERTEYEHDAAGRPDRVVPPRGTVEGATPADFDWNTTYGPVGEAIQVDGPEGSRQTFEYDLLGRRTLQRREDAPSTTVLDNVAREFDDQAREVTTARREGAATTGGLESTIQMDEFGDLISRIDERGKAWSYSNDAGGNRLRETSPEGRITGWEYDDAGNVVAAIGPRGFEDPLSPGESVSDPFDPDETTYEEHRIEIIRDAASGEVTSVIEPGGAESTYRYTLAGQLASATNGEGETTSYHYDWIGRPTGVSSPDGTRSYIEYRDADNERVVRSPMGRETTYSYDDLGRVRSKKLPSGRTWQYDYLPGGLLARVTLPDGTSTICIAGDGTIDREYDALGRPTAIDYSDVSSDDVEWSYDDENSTVTMTDGLGSEIRSYDGLGRLTETSRSGHSTVSYGWLGENLPDTQTVTGADPVDYDYDDDGLVSAVSADSRSTTYARDLAGNIATLSHADGGALVDPSVETREFDAMGRITSLEVAAGVSQLLDLGVSRDLAGRVLEIDRGAGEFERFEYDANGRVELECFADPCDGSGGEWIEHAYDKNGNRTSTTNQAAVVDRFGYDIDDRLTRTKHGSDPATVREHDVRGQVTDDGDHAYWYTQSGAISGIAASGDPMPNTLFGISGGDRRLTETVSSNTTRLVWNDAFGVPQVAAELDGSLGTVERQNVYGPDGITMIQDVGDWHDFTHSPLVGNTELVTDEDATVVATYLYGAFGNDRGTTGTLEQPYRYAGERLTPTTSNYHLRARDYDPSAGVFTAADPVERSVSTPYNGTYNYAEGTPTRYVDPMGTCADHFNWLCDSTVVYMAKNPLETAGIATENAVGVTVGIGVNVYNTASGVAKMCAAGMSSSTVTVPGLPCIIGAGEAIGSGAASVYNSCATTTRHHDALGMAQCFGNTAWSASQKYVSNCGTALATSGYEAGKGCVGDFVLSAASAGAGAAAKGSKIATALDDLDGPKKAPDSCLFSFAGETLVLMGDGSWKAIRDVRVGDVVWATDPGTGKSTVRKVLNTLPHVDHGEFVRVAAADGSIVSTDDHPIWNDTSKRWQRAGTLGSAARVRGIDGALHAVDVSMASPTPGRIVYDLTIDEVHTFHVRIGDAAVLVHNSDTIGTGVCDMNAAREVAENGGTLAHVHNDGGAMGPSAFNRTGTWVHHTVVVRDGRVIDPTTGWSGTPEEFRTLFDYHDALQFEGLPQ